MQAVLVLPSIGESESPASWLERLLQDVSGVPLITRVLATAVRGGVTSVIIVRTSATPHWWLRSKLQSPLIPSLPMQIVGIEPAFDPNDRASWALLASRLAPQFLWLPWNYVTVPRTLTRSVASARSALGPVCAGRGIDEPAVIDTHTLLATHGGSLDEYARDLALCRDQAIRPMGIAVCSAATRRDAERLLVRESGTPNDGMYTEFSRRLCRPLVRWLAKTSITANAVTMVGLLLTMLSALSYAQGTWNAYICGALLFFTSALLDNVDGMLARTKFHESTFGSRLEALARYARDLFPLAGLSIGLSRQLRTPIWLELGAAMLAIRVLSYLVEHFYDGLDGGGPAEEMATL